MDALHIINISAILCALAIALMLLLAMLLGGSLATATHRYFFATLVCNALMILCEIPIAICMGRPGMAAGIVVRVSEYVSHVSGALMHVAFSAYLFAFLREKTRVSLKPLYLIWLCCAMTIVVATVAQFTQSIAWFDAQNNYHQGSLHWLASIFPAASFVLILSFTLYHKKNMRTQEFVSLLLYSVVPIASLAVEMIIPGLWISYLAGSATLFIVYLNIQIETKHRMQAQALALTESRIAIMFSQIQPHFLFNALGAINRLCHGNPTAQEALITFSEYLRVNMDSLTRKEPIPFAQELAHVRQYLWLEALRFEDRLRVVYNIQSESFALPVLTLQPIVENAVRHGVTKKRSGGTVTIRAEDTGRGHRITVLDDGPGFDPQAAVSDDRSHVGIANVRTRLASLCDGTLTIESSPGCGTTATIYIPHDDKEGRP